MAIIASGDESDHYLADAECEEGDDDDDVKRDRCNKKLTERLELKIPNSNELRSSGEEAISPAGGASASPLPPTNHTASSSQELQENEIGSDETVKCLCCQGGLAILFKYVLTTLLSLGLYSLDIYTDLHAAYNDYMAGDLVFAVATFCLVFAPGVVFAFYLFSEVRSHNRGFMRCLKIPFCFLAIPLLPLWPIVNNVKKIIQGLLASFGIRRRHYITLLTSPSKAYLISFLQAYTESAPQLLVRLYRIATRTEDHFSDLSAVEICQLCFSLLSLANAIPSTYQQYVTTSGIISGTDVKLSLLTKLLATFWWLFFLIARFEAMSLFAAAYGWWLCLVIGMHITILFVLQEVSTTINRLKRAMIYIFQSFVFIFAYIQFNVKTRISIPLWMPYVIFAFLMLLENSVMMVLWFLRKSIYAIVSPSSENAHNHQRSSHENVHHHHNNHHGNSDDKHQLSTLPSNQLSSISHGELQQYYDEILMLVHFLSYTVGLIFMLMTLCRSSDRHRWRDSGHEDIDVEEPDIQQEEKQRLTTQHVNSGHKINQTNID